MTTDPRKLLHLCFEVTAFAVYYAPRWLVSATQVWLFEQRKGNWTFARHIRALTKGHMLNVVHKIGLPSSPTPDHTAVQGPSGIWIPAVPEDLIVGEIDTFARDRNIKSIRIPGYWIHKDEALPFETPPSPGEKIFYHFHGGAYLFETAHPQGTMNRIQKELLRNSSSPLLRRTFAAEYRLSSPGEPGKDSVFPFPTALIDALAGYLYLIGLGFSEESIIIVGDSAGANLALALTRYLLSNKERQPKLPEIPSALVLLSPWTDVGDTFIDEPGPSSSLTINAERDWAAPLNAGAIRTCAEAFIGGRPEHIELAFRNPYISPGNPILLGLTPETPTRTISFKGFPKMFIDNAGLETLYDQILRFREVVVEDLGTEMVLYNEVDGAPHDYLIFDWCEPDGANTSRKILNWVGLL